MSAYVVKPETINRFLSFLQDEAIRGSSRVADFQKKLAELEWNLTDPADLGSALFNLNCRAVSGRYPDDRTRADQPGYPGEYRFEYVLTGQFQALKSLRCWLYQCAEGDIPEKSKLFKAFRDFSKSWALKLLEEVPEYQKAEWA
jgi:hypothetical protein